LEAELSTIQFFRVFSSVSVWYDSSQLSLRLPAGTFRGEMTNT
jgi:hypothetical protein